jgi:hypothetical protein
MSEIKVNKISPKQTCTQVTLGDSGDTFTIPAGVTFTNNGTATGFGATGAVNWDTTKITADPNPAVSGVGYFADTTSSAFTVTLPAAPSAGDIVALSDYTGTFATNNLTIGRNGSNIRGSATDLVLNVNNQTITLIYVDGTEGWNVIQESNNINNFVAATGGTVLTCGDFKIHTFTGPGTFTVTNAGNPLGSDLVDYLVVAGGGGGGDGPISSVTSGGGGAGGYRTTFPSPGCNAGSFPITATAYPITVGAGGGSEVSGNPSIFSTITSTGGGRGGKRDAFGGDPGGSGGGGGSTGSPAGSGNTPPTSPPQGNNGGIGAVASSFYTGGGGGGASAVGTAGNPGTGIAGNGGAGSTNLINGTPTARAGGGGGAADNPAGTSGGLGGAGGGGIGSLPGRSATSGTANTGGGGGANTNPGVDAGSGGSGIVVIRYKFK